MIAHTYSVSAVILKWGLWLAILFTQFYIMILVHDLLTNSKTYFGKNVWLVLTRFIPTLIVMLLSISIVLIGLSLGLVPGIYLIVVLFPYALFFALIDKVSIGEGVLNALDLIRGYWWRCLSIGVLACLPCWCLYVNVVDFNLTALGILIFVVHPLYIFLMMQSFIILKQCPRYETSNAKRVVTYLTFLFVAVLFFNTAFKIYQDYKKDPDLFKPVQSHWQLARAKDNIFEGNYKKAYKSLLPLATDKNSEAMMGLGFLAETGRGQPVNYV